MIIESESVLDYELVIFKEEVYTICKYERNRFTDMEWDDFLDYDDRLFILLFQIKSLHLGLSEKTGLQIEV